MSIQVAWVEIPASNIERASQFYGALFDAKFDIIDGGARQISIVTAVPGGVGVSINQTSNFEPGAKGLSVAFAAGSDIATFLSRVEPAGGKILTQRGELMLPNNYFATVQDTEGNVFGFVWAEEN